MGIFSLAAEKGARYLCVVLPFMAIAVAVALENLLSFEKYKKYILTLAVLASLLMFVQSLRIVMSSTDYEKAIDWVQLRDPNAGILSTQPLVEQLYVRNERMVQEAPRNLVDLINLYQQGFRYLIVDPQAYISWTKDKERFTYPLIDFMEFIVKNVPPVIVFDHLNSVLLERFVLDHNQNLTQSLKFLSNTSKEGFNRIRVFDIGQCLLLLKKQAMEKI
jgi:hypothetical protein